MLIMACAFSPDVISYFLENKLMADSNIDTKVGNEQFYIAYYNTVPYSKFTVSVSLLLYV